MSKKYKDSKTIQIFVTPVEKEWVEYNGEYQSIKHIFALKEDGSVWIKTLKYGRAAHIEWQLLAP